MKKSSRSTLLELTTNSRHHLAGRLVGGLAIGLVASLATPAQALTVTWDGGGGDNVWITPTNWSADALPGAADVATFDSANLAISRTGGGASTTLDGMAYTANATGSVNITLTATGDNRIMLDGGAATDISVVAGNHTYTGYNNSAGDFQFTANQVWDIATGASLTFANVHMRSGSLGTMSKTGGGLVVFGGNSVGTSNAMAFGGSTFVVNNGTLKIAHNLASGAAANKYTVSSGATLELAANYNSVDGTLTISGAGYGGVGAINNSSGTNTFADGTASVVMAADSSIGVASGTLTLNQDITESGGARQLTKIGTGTLILGNANTYTGTTTVALGTLLANNTSNSATGTGEVAVATGGTLGGTGTISGASTIGASGKLAPTAQADGGHLTLGTTTFTANSIFQWDMSPANPAVDPVTKSNQGTYGQVAAGATTGTSVFTIVLGSGSYSDAFWNTDKTWSNIYVSSGLSDLSSVFTTLAGTSLTYDAGTNRAIATGEGYFTFNGSSTMSWTAVPEPTSALAGILLGSGLLRRRRS